MNGKDNYSLLVDMYIEFIVLISVSLMIDIVLRNGINVIVNAVIFLGFGILLCFAAIFIKE